MRYLLGTMMLLGACARHLAPVDVRTVSRVDEIRDVDKDAAYSRALVWFQNKHDRAGITATTSAPVFPSEGWTISGRVHRPVLLVTGSPVSRVESGTRTVGSRGRRCVVPRLLEAA